MPWQEDASLRRDVNLRQTCPVDSSGVADEFRSDDLGLGDPDAEAFEADIVALARGEKIDRGNAEILQDLRAEPDLAPFALAPERFFMALAVLDRQAIAGLVSDADRSLPEIDDDAATLRGHRLHDVVAGGGGCRKRR